MKPVIPLLAFTACLMIIFFTSRPTVKTERERLRCLHKFFLISSSVSPRLSLLHRPLVFNASWSRMIRRRIVFRPWGSPLYVCVCVCLFGCGSKFEQFLRESPLRHDYFPTRDTQDRRTETRAVKSLPFWSSPSPKPSIHGVEKKPKEASHDVCVYT